jgi:hypothetical protein
MAKQIVCDEQSSGRAAQRQSTADAVKVTLGEGMQRHLGQKFDPTMQGRRHRPGEIDLKDPLENMGAQMSAK